MININNAGRYKSAHKKIYDIFLCMQPENVLFYNKLEQPQIAKILPSFGRKGFLSKDDVSALKQQNPAGFNLLSQCVQKGMLYTTSNDNPFILAGTRGEMWSIKGPKLQKGYSFVTDTGTEPINADTLKKRCGSGKGFGWKRIRTEKDPTGVMALFVPVEQKGQITTSWGAVLTYNDPSVPHGKGDFIIASCLPDGKPNMNDRWVVNGLIFKDTYDNRGWSDCLANEGSTQTAVTKCLAPDIYSVKNTGSGSSNYDPATAKKIREKITGYVHEGEDYVIHTKKMYEAHMTHLSKSSVSAEDIGEGKVICSLYNDKGDTLVDDDGDVLSVETTHFEGSDMSKLGAEFTNGYDSVYFSMDELFKLLSKGFISKSSGKSQQSNSSGKEIEMLKNYVFAGDIYVVCTKKMSELGLTVTNGTLDINYGSYSLVNDDGDTVVEDDGQCVTVESVNFEGNGELGANVYAEHDDIWDEIFLTVKDLYTLLSAGCLKKSNARVQKERNEIATAKALVNNGDIFIFHTKQMYDMHISLCDGELVYDDSDGQNVFYSLVNSQDEYMADNDGEVLTVKSINATGDAVFESDFGYEMEVFPYEFNELIRSGCITKDIGDYN